MDFEQAYDDNLGRVFAFLAYRLLRTLIALWLVSSVVFAVMRLSGDPVPLLLPPDAPIAEMERVRHDLGLDRSLPVQYAVFIGNVLHGDFGRSIHFRQPAMDVALSYLPATFELGEVDSGTPERPIIYCGVEPGSVRLVGGKLLPTGAFKKVTEPAVLDRLERMALARWPNDGWAVVDVGHCAFAVHFCTQKF